MRSPRTALLSLVLVAVGVLAVLLLATFLVPDAQEPRSATNIGHIEDYPLDSVTPLFAESVPVKAWAVRQSDGELLILSARSPNGCTVPWRDTLNEPGLSEGFKDPCRLAVWTQDGTLQFGAARRDLDHYAYDVQANGDVIVNFERLIPGTPRPEAPLTREAYAR